MDISSEIIEVEKDPIKFLNYSLFYPKCIRLIQRYDAFKPSLDDPAVSIENITAAYADLFWVWQRKC